jgi:hypothetical protein
MRQYLSVRHSMGSILEIEEAFKTYKELVDEYENASDASFHEESPALGERVLVNLIKVVAKETAY